MYVVDPSMLVFPPTHCNEMPSLAPTMPCLQVKEALITGGISRSNKPDGVRSTPGIKTWEDLVGGWAD